MAIRVDETTDAMVSIAKFLGGYPGRKNLLWFSESFPDWIAPSSDFGADSFQGTADYSDKIRKASQALTDARIAVYPVDARGLEANQITSASSNPHINPRNPGGGFGGQLGRENNTRIDTQATMQQIAEQTGGKTCVNTNDLSGCVQGALDDSSAYYELAYYPENVKWDGKFHKITVKSNQHGIKLRYRTRLFRHRTGRARPADSGENPPAGLYRSVVLNGGFPDGGIDRAKATRSRRRGRSPILADDFAELADPRAGRRVAATESSNGDLRIHSEWRFVSDLSP